MELIFKPCGQFRWSPEGPVNQIHSPNLHVGVPVIFSDLLRSLQILEREREREREWVAESNGKLPQQLIPGKTAALVPEFAVEDLPSAELQSWFLSLQWKTCLQQNCNLGSWVCSGRPAFGQNLQHWFLSLWWKTYLWQHSKLGSCSCSEGPALG